MIRVLDPGFFTSIQDAGRKGFRHLGVPVSGAMDQYAFAVANTLLPHPNDQCVLECTYHGPTLALEKSVRFVVTGAPISIDLDGKSLGMNTVYLATEGSILTLGKVQKGVRSYLRFSGELLGPKPMGSASMFYPITPHGRLRKNDTIECNVLPQNHSIQNAKLNVHQEYITREIIEVNAGPDWNQLPPDSQKQLLTETHRVEGQNRMGYRLSTAVDFSVPQLLSQVVIPGMIQLTPGKKLLVATADCQVTGGYLQVLQILPKALNVLVQKPEHCTLTFRNKQT